MPHLTTNPIHIFLLITEQVTINMCQVLQDGCQLILNSEMPGQFEVHCSHFKEKMAVVNSGLKRTYV